MDSTMNYLYFVFRNSTNLYLVKHSSTDGSFTSGFSISNGCTGKGWMWKFDSSYSNLYVSGTNQLSNKFNIIEN